MHEFWDSPEGKFTQFHRRRSEALDVALALEPPTKKTRRGTQEKARAALASAFQSDVRARWARELTAWPKLQAAIALDIVLFSSARNGARVDSICKWLLDELSGHVYSDDRQVKLLYAKVARSRSRKKVDAPAENPWDAGFDFDWPEPDSDKEPALYITAQTRANVFKDLRAVSDLEERWDPFEKEHGVRHRDPQEFDWELDELLDYQSMFANDSEEGRLQHQLVTNRIDYENQSHQQHLVDMVFSSLLTDMPVDRFGVWSRVRDRLQYSPYMFNLGVLPTYGGSHEFQERLRATLRDRRESYPGLFPMRARSGVTMILFEEQRGGKDLDNLIRTILPDVLEILRPQQHDLPGWVADDVNPDDAVADIPFIEVAAYPAHLTDMPPGSVIFGLSSADRYGSWWSRAIDHLELVLEDEQE
ncbi:RusA family crossover junction endodeoxyribonuclease [Microbacterium paraoxydans]|uniref:RusA family crossover junction endodeoxyribonuclease n=1 Tax=Microbacterium paraoxydans TaxID=199592 RepID=UPI001CFAD77B|nr:RusA family crossover junction endodeoxyribonuclease [Microbacterium paraoxydans]